MIHTNKLLVLVLNNLAIGHSRHSHHLITRSAFLNSSKRCFSSSQSDSESSDSKKQESSIQASTHYSTLGVEATASQEEIKNAFFKLSKIYHPDRQIAGTRKKDGTAKFQELSAAYSVIGDVKNRKEYDRNVLQIRRKIIYDDQDQKQNQNIYDDDEEDYTDTIYRRKQKADFKRGSGLRTGSGFVPSPSRDRIQWVPPAKLTLEEERRMFEEGDPDEPVVPFSLFATPRVVVESTKKERQDPRKAGQFYYKQQDGELNQSKREPDLVYDNVGPGSDPRDPIPGSTLGYFRPMDLREEGMSTIELINKRDYEYQRVPMTALALLAAPVILLLAYKSFLSDDFLGYVDKGQRVQVMKSNLDLDGRPTK